MAINWGPQGDPYSQAVRGLASIGQPDARMLAESQYAQDAGAGEGIPAIAQTWGPYFDTLQGKKVNLAGWGTPDQNLAEDPAWHQQASAAMPMDLPSAVNGLKAAGPQPKKPVAPTNPYQVQMPSVW